MNKSVIHIILFFFMVLAAQGQISPGDLTQAHAQFEGMSNCTQCHDIGEKVSSTKCLDCHKEIKALVNQNKGYHASRNVRAQDCFDCHSEHHGRKFDMVRFDTQKFDHKTTGYTLEGEHATVDCKECHKSENITQRELKNRKDTYLGLDTKCLSCHEDFHQNTLPTDCMQCHSMSGFTPVTKFDHSKTDFPLKGEHAQVDCKECHKETTRNGKPFQEFGGLDFKDCVSCHSDPHNKKLPGTCVQCHTETSFTTFTGKSNFNHTRTGFPLKGAHKVMDCFECHQKRTDPLTVFQDRQTTEANNCVACHADVHENKFGQDCAKCHNEESFFALNNMDFFDHNVTDFALEGQHQEVDCKACHKERFSVPIDFSRCSNCHDDYHQGEFVSNGSSPDCMECHTVDKKFDYTLFTLEKHQSTDFPLEGAHVATPCFACHVSEEEDRWSFADKGGACIDCHTDFHDGFLPEKYYPADNCAVCHVSDTWSRVGFDHSKTQWPLEGKHKEVSCKECHFNFDDKGAVISQKFTNLESACISCHENVHGTQFEVKGVTDCTRCHVTDSWFPRKFDHRKTRFALEGKHAEISCEACHLVPNKSGVLEPLYKLNKLECVDCHLQ